MISKEREQELIKSVEGNHRFLQQLSADEQTRAVCMAALNKQPFSYDYIIDKENPTYIKRALKLEGEVIKLVKNQTLEWCELAVETTPYSFSKCKFVSEKMVLSVIENRFGNIVDIPSPFLNKNALTAAIVKSPRNLSRVLFQTKENVLVAISSSKVAYIYVNPELKEYAFEIGEQMYGRDMWKSHRDDLTDDQIAEYILKYGMDDYVSVQKERSIKRTTIGGGGKFKWS